MQSLNYKAQVITTLFYLTLLTNVRVTVHTQLIQTLSVTATDIFIRVQKNIYRTTKVEIIRPLMVACYISILSANFINCSARR